MPKTHDRNHAAKQAAITRGVAIVATGKSCLAAAIEVLPEYPKKITVEHLAKKTSKVAKSK